MCAGTHNKRGTSIYQVISLFQFGHFLEPVSHTRTCVYRGERYKKIHGEELRFQSHHEGFYNRLMRASINCGS